MAGRLWIVVGPKEGLGATTTVANLGVELQRLGRDVVLVDMDMRCGDLAVVLNLDPVPSFADLLRMDVDVDRLFLEACLTRHQAGLSLLPCRPGGPDGRMASATRVQALLQDLCAGHDLVIVDAPPPLSEPVAAALAAADGVLLLTELTVPCLRAAWQTHERIVELRAGEGPEIVVTKHVAELADLTLDDAAHVLGRRPLTTLARDDSALHAVNGGVPLADLDTGGSLRRDVVALARCLAATAPHHDWAIARRPGLIEEN